MNYPIIQIAQHPDKIDAAAHFFANQWAVDFTAYQQSMIDSLTNTIPQWFIVCDEDKIIGGCGIIDNDFHKRPDLTPNICALYVESEYRGKNIARSLLDHCCDYLDQHQIDDVYLITDHSTFYEKCGFDYLEDIQENDGNYARMYHRKTDEPKLERYLKKLANYRKTLYRHPKLKTLFFELTDCCNLSCLHCGSRCTSNNSTYLPKEAIFKVLDDVKQHCDGLPTIALTGGEPLLHPDFFEIVDYINRSGFRWGITSNATLFSEKVTQKLIDYNMGSISISLDGLQETHNQLRNEPTAYTRAIRGIQNLVKVGKGKTIIQTTTVVSRLNIHQLEQLYELMKWLQLDSWRVINLEPIGRALDHPELLLKKDDYIRLFDFIEQKRNLNEMDVTYGCSHYLTKRYEGRLRDYAFICGSGIYVASVLCNGDIYSCLDIERRKELIQGNIYTDSFMEVWKQRFQPFRIDRSSYSQKCMDCADKDYCAADSTHTYHFDLEKPYICMKEILED